MELDVRVSTLRGVRVDGQVSVSDTAPSLTSKAERAGRQMGAKMFHPPQ